MAPPWVGPAEPTLSPRRAETLGDWPVEGRNAFVESFNGRMREELLNLEVFDSLCRGERRDRGLVTVLSPGSATDPQDFDHATLAYSAKRPPFYT